MKLIVISSSTSIENEDVIITKFFELGLKTFHIRNSKLSTKKMKELIAKIPEQYHNRIVINSHFSLARKLKLKGIHLTKTHKKRKWRTKISIFFIKLFNPNISISTSYNSVAQLFDFQKKHNYNYAYVFLSPIFDSFTNKFQSGFTENVLKSAFSKIKLDVIARGGVDATTVEKAHEIGFTGIALYSCIWKRKDPILEFKKVVDKLSELNIQIE